MVNSSAAVSPPRPHSLSRFSPAPPPPFALFVSPKRFLFLVSPPPTPQEAEIVRVIERTLNETCKENRRREKGRGGERDREKEWERESVGEQRQCRHVLNICGQFYVSCKNKSRQGAGREEEERRERQQKRRDR